MSSAPDVAGLAEALHPVAGAVVVDGRDRLAVLRPSREGYGRVLHRRDEVLSLARQRGFTHVCLELEG